MMFSNAGGIPELSKLSTLVSKLAARVGSLVANELSAETVQLLLP